MPCMSKQSIAQGKIRMLGLEAMGSLDVVLTKESWGVNKSTISLSVCQLVVATILVL